MSNDQEWRRLQGLYAAMSDGELLRLAADKDGLTQVAQEAIDAEMSGRGLKLPEPEEEETQSDVPSLLAAEGDDLVVLIRTQSATEANLAATHLETAGIPFELQPERYRETEADPWIYSGLLQIVIKSDRRPDAVHVLRKEMGLFPLAEVDDRADEADDSGEQDLYQVGNFELASDAEVATKALHDAGIWFTAERVTEDPADDSSLQYTFVEVRFGDLERALEVVETAFDEAEK